MMIRSGKELRSSRLAGGSLLQIDPMEIFGSTLGPTGAPGGMWKLIWKLWKASAPSLDK